MHVRRHVVGATVGVITLGLVLSEGTSALAGDTPLDLIRGSKVHGLVISPQTKFKLETLKSRMIGFGMSSPNRAGEEALQRFEIPDPAVLLRERFLASLGDDSAAEVLFVPGSRDSDNVDGLVRAFGEGFVLDFRTRIWRLMYSPGKKQHRFEYWGRIRLIGLADAKVLWNETCKYLGNAAPTEQGEEDMLGNDAALLKATMSMAVDQCVAELSSRLGAP